MKIWIAIAASLALGAAAAAQDTGDRVTVPFPSASQPRTLVVDMIRGGITVRAYNGNDAIVEGQEAGSMVRGRESNPPPGMHRIGNGGSGMDVAQDGNTITVKGGVMRQSNVTIQVPAQTSLRLKTMSGGSILVEGISGEIEAENMNGAVTITSASGSVVAHSMNGAIKVSLDHVTPSKAMSFSTMNGTIDVTLPADVKANLKMKTDHGEIYSDFDVKVDGQHPPTVTSRNGRRRVRFDQTTYGTINGGGPEMNFLTYNGDILIHKK